MKQIWKLFFHKNHDSPTPHKICWSSRVRSAYLHFISTFVEFCFVAPIIFLFLFLFSYSMTLVWPKLPVESDSNSDNGLKLYFNKTVPPLKSLGFLKIVSMFCRICVSPCLRLLGFIRGLGFFVNWSSFKQLTSIGFARFASMFQQFLTWTKKGHLKQINGPASI